MAFPIALIGQLAGAAMSAIGGGISAGLSSQQQSFNNDLQQKSLALQYMQYLYQKDYDQWSQKFAETQRQDSLNAFNQQMQLAKSPISTLIQDGSSVGVNPMAAMGQNVGSASFSGGSIPSSNVNGGFGASSVPDSLGSSLMSMVTSLAQTSMNNETQKDINNKTLANQRNMQLQELQFLREKQSQEYNLGLEGNERAKERNAIQSRLASVEEGQLVRMSKKDVHDMLVDDRKLLLERARDRFNRKLAQTQFDWQKDIWKKEFNEQIKQFEKKFDQTTNENLRKWEHMDKYNRTRLASSIVHEINADFRACFGIMKGEPEYDAYQTSGIGFKF